MHHYSTSGFIDMQPLSHGQDQWSHSSAAMGNRECRSCRHLLGVESDMSGIKVWPCTARVSESGLAVVTVSQDTGDSGGISEMVCIGALGRVQGRRTI